MKQKLLMIPGPTPVDRSILNALSKETVSHQDPQLVGTLAEVLKDLNTIVMTKKGQSFTVPGTGTLALERLISENLKPPILDGKLRQIFYVF